MSWRKRIGIVFFLTLVALAACAGYVRAHYVVPILMYHSVHPGASAKSRLEISDTVFERQMKFLRGHRYNIVTVEALADMIDRKQKIPPKTIALTFDDGYRDFYTDVYPILKKYQIKATAYIISGFLGYPNNMDAAQVKRIADDGLVEIGAHTVHHAWLKNLSAQELTYEVYQCKKTLEKPTGKPVVSFAYPYGAFDVPAIQTLAAAGFTSAVSTIPGADQYQTHRFFLYRLRPGGKTGQDLLSWLDGVKSDQISYVIK